jgi:hypothetical protein
VVDADPCAATDAIGFSGILLSKNNKIKIISK